MRGVCGLAATLAGCVYTAPSPVADDASPSDSPVDMPPPDMPPDMPPQPFWLNVIGAEALDGSLKDIANNGWRRSGAVTRDQIVSGNGFLQFSTAENTRLKAFGLSNGDTDADVIDIDFGIQMRGNRTLDVIEKGVVVGSFGNYVANEVFRIEVVSNVVTYKRGGVVFFVSTAIPTFPLLGDAALYTTNATITNVSIGSL
jgi:hypothetical protein